MGWATQIEMLEELHHGNLLLHHCELATRAGTRAHGKGDVGKPMGSTMFPSFRSEFECIFAPESLAVVHTHRVYDHRRAVGHSPLLPQHLISAGLPHEANRRRDQSHGLLDAPIQIGHLAQMFPSHLASSNHFIDLLQQLAFASGRCRKEAQTRAHGGCCGVLTSKEKGEDVVHNHFFSHRLSCLWILVMQHHVQQIPSLITGRPLLSSLADDVYTGRAHVVTGSFKFRPPSEKEWSQIAGAELERWLVEEIDCFVEGHHVGMRFRILEAAKRGPQTTHRDGLEGHLGHPGINVGGLAIAHFPL
mmetsp:Transcript_37902/g.46972  ORF Transcript_37902/g.46972 Transcript_37902/m.46972 type:complete len:304 (-) Transcript_37902:571-1482(-)